jgi:Flp pilus assembly protein TadG
MLRQALLVKGDRRGVAALEVVYTLPVIFVMMFAVSDAVQLGRTYLRAQSAAIQVGQIISQCAQVSADDEAVLNTLTKNILDPANVRNAPYALRITAFGRDSADKAITPWAINQSGGTKRPGETAPALAGTNATLPTGYTMGKNQVLFRTEVVWSADKNPLTRLVSLLSTKTSLGFTTAGGEAVFSTRVSNTDTLKTKGASGAKGCLT